MSKKNKNKKRFLEFVMEHCLCPTWIQKEYIIEIDKRVPKSVVKLVKRLIENHGFTFVQILIMRVEETPVVPPVSFHVYNSNEKIRINGFIPINNRKEIRNVVKLFDLTDKMLSDSGDAKIHHIEAIIHLIENMSVHKNELEYCIIYGCPCTYSTYPMGVLGLGKGKLLMLTVRESQPL